MFLPIYLSLQIFFFTKWNEIQPFCFYQIAIRFELWSSRYWPRINVRFRVEWSLMDVRVSHLEISEKWSTSFGKVFSLFIYIPDKNLFLVKNLNYKFVLIFIHAFITILSLRKLLQTWNIEKYFVIKFISFHIKIIQIYNKVCYFLSYIIASFTLS